MIWHPLLLAVLALDGLSLVFLLTAAATAGQIFMHWSPASSDRAQILLERRAESARVSAAFGVAFFGLAGVLLIVAITNVLPDLVPGAMCGTGVIQATKGIGGRAIGLRLLAVLILSYRVVFEQWNRSLPEQPLTAFNSRLLLLAMPFVAMAIWDTAGAVRQLDTHQPVSCCAVVYDQFRSLTAARQTAGIPESAWVAAFWLSAVGLCGCGWRVWRSKTTPSAGPAARLTGLVLLWLPVAAIVLVRRLAAYHYEVLHHHCPWCLFLPEHHLVGFLLFGLLSAIAFEGLLPLAAAGVAGRLPELATIVGQRGRTAGLRVLALVIVFVAVAIWPAIVWRVQHGVWLG
jgi:hypothetical protein